jgi:hypothetical protein
MIIIIIEIEDSVENKPIIYKNLIYNDIRPDGFDLGLLEKALDENYEKDANACDNIKDYDNNEGDNNNESEFIKSYKEFSQLFDIDNIDESCLSPWILRLSFDKEALMNRKLTIQEIQETIKENFHNDQEIDCVYSDDSVNDVIMRIRIKQDSKGNFLEFMKDFEKQLIEFISSEQKKGNRIIDILEAMGGGDDEVMSHILFRKIVDKIESLGTGFVEEIKRVLGKR